MYPTVKDLVYYQGDSFTIYVFPKDATGAAITLTENIDIPFFHVADRRGAAGVAVQVTAELVDIYDNGTLCIKGEMDSNTGEMIRNGWVYDIGWRSGSPVEYVTTAFTGSFKVMENVKGYVG